MYEAHQIRCAKAHVKNVCMHSYIYIPLKTRACRDAQAGLQLVPQPQVLREWNSLWASPVNTDEGKKANFSLVTFEKPTKSEN